MRNNYTRILANLFLSASLLTFTAASATRACAAPTITKPTITVNEGYIHVRGGEVWYRAVGIDKKGIPLLVLHGGPGMTHFYLDSLEALATDRPVIFYDQLGCGNSITTEKDTKPLWTVERFVEEVQTVRTALKLRELHLFGNSWGSMLAVDYLSSLKDMKGIHSVILSGPFMSTPIWIDGAKKCLKSLPENTQKIVEESEQKGDYTNAAYQDAVTVFYKNFLCRVDPWPPSVMKAFNLAGAEVYSYMWGPSEFTCTGTLKGYDVLDKLKLLKIPVLFTVGEFDEARQENAEYFRSLVPGAELFVVQGAAHMHNVEKPEECNKVISAFMQKHE